MSNNNNGNKGGGSHKTQDQPLRKREILENDLNKSFRPTVKPDVESSLPPKAPPALPKKPSKSG